MAESKELDMTGVEPEYQEAFRQFAKTSEIDPSWRPHLNTCKNCQGAVERLIEKEGRPLERILGKRG